ncbi:CPBP family intramembrane glutamic endopeptidase [Promicromonospora iranensis]|uniref:Membrane protease YdiL (CAAX protease family) n=1 Tax=Promicromonospora iranensis TaxID=1105144 RepID=A0ABU2CHR9_9MICO|nr:CPBP family intramembrane glutamic endopeptidase [Promicromonospora iranensis]MDR7380869.1 membrane protease YdiL (CAAX protease family) [Promicromonospora iranensis]
MDHGGSEGGPAPRSPVAQRAWLPGLIAAGCLVAAVVGGHPVAGPIVAGASLVLIVVQHAGHFGPPRRAPSGAPSVAALAVCLVAAIWTLRGVGAALEAVGVAGATSVALWPVPLVAAVGLYVLASRVRALGLVDDWFRRGTMSRVGLWLTAAIVPVSALALVVWSWAVGEDGSGHDSYRQLLADQGPAVVVLGALAFSFVNAAAEECAYNGVAQRAFGRDMRGAVAVVLAAVMFGASHWYGFPSGWWGVFLAAGYGLVLSALRHVSHGLLLPWVAHVLADLTIVAVLLMIW